MEAVSCTGASTALEAPGGADITAVVDPDSTRRERHEENNRVLEGVGCAIIGG